MSKEEEYRCITPTKLKHSKISIDHFTQISVIGSGTFAKVHLVRYSLNDKVYAMKIIKKSHLKDMHLESTVLTERNILTNINHPFIIKFFSSFQSENKLFFVLEYCPGGELYNYLYYLEETLSEEASKFYAAQILLGIEALH